MSKPFDVSIPFTLVETILLTVPAVSSALNQAETVKEVNVLKVELVSI